MTVISNSYPLTPIECKHLEKLHQGKVVIVLDPEGQQTSDGKVNNIGHVHLFCIDPETNKVLVNVKLATGLVEAFDPKLLYISE
jgi:hypothetical protein